jgi:hypothetical protein
MSSKINRLAVLLCGDLRTWDTTADNIFKLMESCADNVDYYFATWTTTQDFWCPQTESIKSQRTESIKSQRAVQEHEITDKFHGRNLIKYQLVELSKYDPAERLPTFYYQAYLSKLANIFKRRYELENNFVYDQVIELRPDLGIEFQGKPSLGMKPCREFEYSISHTFYGPEGMYLGMLSDFYYRAASFTNDIISNRCTYYHHDTPTTNYLCGLTIVNHNHWLLFSYIYSRLLVNHYVINHTGDFYSAEENAMWPVYPANNPRGPRIPNP